MDDGKECDTNDDCLQGRVCDKETPLSTKKTCGIRKDCQLSDFEEDKLLKMNDCVSPHLADNTTTCYCKTN